MNSFWLIFKQNYETEEKLRTSLGGIMKKNVISLIAVMFVLAVSGAAVYAEDGQVVLEKAGEQLDKNGQKKGMNIQKEEQKGKEKAMTANFEVSLYDFVNKNFGVDNILKENSFLFACNFNLSDIDISPSKIFSVTFGPYFSQNHGSNDLGLRGTGYFFPHSKKQLPIYAALSGSGFYSFLNQITIMSFALKFGIELPLDQAEIFLEGGMKIQTNSNYSNLLVNAGIRVYLF